jgi:hypothetical protein
MKNIGVNSIAELNRYKECLQHYIYAQNSGLRDGKKIADLLQLITNDFG